MPSTNTTSSAASHLRGPPGEGGPVDGIAQTKRGGKRVSYGELAKANGGSIAVEATYSDTSKIHEASMCAQVAEVEVDPETGQVKLRKFTSAHNTGTVINPLMHQGQIEGGAMRSEE